MERTSPSHYIAPGAISVTPNANGSASDLAVYVVKGARILVYSMGIPALGWNDSAYRQWTLTGRNRRLADDTKPYTIYARLLKNNSSDGYLIFAPKVADGDNWLDKYAYVTIKGLATGTANQNNSNYWYVKLGEVSLPVDGKRTVTLDTGILGTDQFNSEWNLDPDDMPLRVELTSAIDGVDAGDKPYVKWGKELILSAKLLEGWTNADVERFHHWTIQRNTGNASADAAWNFPTDNSYAEHPSTGREVPNGNIALSHARGEGDMFGGAVSSLWTVIAWGLKEGASSSSSENSSASSSSSVSTSPSVSSSSSSSSPLPEYVEKYEVLAQGTINILAETAEQYALELSVNMVNYDPTTDTYNPSEGIDVMVRAIDQKGEVFKLTKAQLSTASLAVQFSVAALDQWNTCVFDGADEAVAKANIPIEAFHLQKPVNVRIVKVATSDSSSGSSSANTTTYTELYRTPIAFVRNGEDSKDREWIFMRSQSAVSFSSDASDATKPLAPSIIAKGEVNPEEAAGGVDSNKNQDGWVPEGWWDEAQGTNNTYHYEYSAYRDYIKETTVDSSSSGNSSSSADVVRRGGHWGDFSMPRIWSYYAEDAVSYRCRWTLAGVEVYQLKCSYTGAFRGTLPLVATLMKRVGNGQEHEVTGKAVIVLSCDGIDFSKTFNADNPTFSVDAGNADTKDFIQYLNSVSLNGLSAVFTVNGEAHTFSIPVIREADEDSVKDTLDKYGSDKFLSKINDDTAKGLITFLSGLISRAIATFSNGAKFGNNFVAGITGEGGMIDGKGNAWLRNLDLSESLTVPKLSYNIVEICPGVQWQSAGGGTIKSVEIEKDADGNATMNGIVTLDLKEGEIGQVKEGDLCLGIFHSTLAEVNETEDTETETGIITRAGFYTCYFRVTDIMEGEFNSKFRYVMRSDDEWSKSVHPSPQMTFVVFGNPTYEDRQKSCYRATNYTRYLAGVTTWKMGVNNIACQIGDLSNLNQIQGYEFLRDYSGFFNNIYITGHVEEIEDMRSEVVMSGIEDNRIEVGGSRTLTFSLRFQNKTVDGATWKMVRESGLAEADAEWNAAHKDVSSPMVLTSDDMGDGAYLQGVMFTLTGSGEYRYLTGKTVAVEASKSMIITLLSRDELWIDFVPVEGKSFVVKASNVNTIVEARLMYGNTDITDAILLRSSSEMEWTRDSGIPEEDNAWVATVGGSPNIIHIIDRANERHDCGSYWMQKLKVSFTFTCKVIFAAEPVTLTGTLGIGNQ